MAASYTSVTALRADLADPQRREIAIHWLMAEKVAEWLNDGEEEVVRALTAWAINKIDLGCDDCLLALADGLLDDATALATLDHTQAANDMPMRVAQHFNQLRYNLPSGTTVQDVTVSQHTLVTDRSMTTTVARLPYSLTLTADHRRAIDWVGDRYWNGTELWSVLTDGEMTKMDDGMVCFAEWNDKCDITFYFTESQAWVVQQLAEHNDMQYDCFAPELVAVFTQFFNGLV